MTFSTKNPPAIQRIPWPEDDEDDEQEIDEDQQESARKTKLENYDQWLINEHDFPWLVEPEGTAYSSREGSYVSTNYRLHIVSISRILFSRTTGVESWIASDGRAYVVYLDHDSEEPISNSGTSPKNGWMGTCIHNFETPRWVQKRRRVEPHEQEDVTYFEPNRAVQIAMNAKFSLIAVGLLG